MTKVRIEGFARIKKGSTDDPDGIRLGSRDIEDEVVDINEGDVIVSDGPISFEIVEDDE